MKNKKVLVTGGAGFIGSHLCETLLETGNEVVCVDNLSMGSSENIKNFGSENFKFVKGDVTVLNDLKRVFAENDFDFVFHEAAVVGVKRTLENPLSVLSDIEGFKNVLELSKESGVKKLIFSSSSEVYGNPVEIPEREDGHVNASFPYATVKLIGEQYCRAYYDIYGLKTTSLRFFNVYGPRQESTPYGFVVGIFIRQALQDMRTSARENQLHS
jgi:UDP-glucose 4-epimerase